MKTVNELPAVQQAVTTRPLFVMQLQAQPPLAVGVTPGGERRIAVVSGGTFQGERLSGVVLPSGADWQIVRPDGAITMEVALALKTDDGALIGMTYAGLRHGPAAVMAAIARGEAVDPADYYFRTQLRFETAAPAYDWLNRILAIGIGDRQAGGPIYSVFEVL